VRLQDVEDHGLATVDKKHLVAHMEGDKLTPMQAIHAYCYSCMNGFADGKEDCGMSECPLYPFMRYNPNRKINKRALTDKQRKDIGVRLRKNS